ncbi:MAG: hypothetical protein ABF577_13295 [Acetobacter sp.]
MENAEERGIWCAGRMLLAFATACKWRYGRDATPHLFSPCRVENAGWGIRQTSRSDNSSNNKRAGPHGSGSGTKYSKRDIFKYEYIVFSVVFPV